MLHNFRTMNLNQKGSIIAKYNYLIAAILVLAAVSWPYVQKKTDEWVYQREAKQFFELIQEKQLKYSLINNRYLPFKFQNNEKELNALDLNLKKAKYYDFGVIEIDNQTFHIIAQLKPKVIKRWYLIGSKTKLELVYEKKAGKPGRIL